MRIVVCVKQVPDSSLSITVGEDGFLVRGEDDIVNEIDENAIEAAVALAEDLQERGQQVEVIALGMGPEGADEAITRALQMGADQALMLSDEALAGADAARTAAALALAIANIEAGTDDIEGGAVDLIFAGSSSSDAVTSLVPQMLGAYLSRPVISGVNAFEAGEGQVSATVTGAQVSLPLPAIVAVSDQVNSPRYPNFAAITAARSKPLTEVELADLDFAALANEAPVRAVLEGPATIELTSFGPADTHRAHQINPATAQNIAELAEFLQSR